MPHEGKFSHAHRRWIFFCGLAVLTVGTSLVQSMPIGRKPTAATVRDGSDESVSTAAHFNNLVPWSGRKSLYFPVCA